MVKLLILVCVLIASQLLNAQYLNGKITANYTDLKGVTIINTTQKIAVTSEENGLFKIKAVVKDSLLVTAVQFNSKTVVLTKEDFDKELFLIRLSVHTNYIDEVTVVKEKDGYEAGILSKKAKIFTPAERKLNTASNMYPTANVGAMTGGSLGLDPVLNWISGRTKRLKQELNVEQKEVALQKINYLFDETYFIQTLKIPEDKLEGFLYFIVEDAEFKKTLSSKNKTMTKFLLIDLAKFYLKLQN